MKIHSHQHKKSIDPPITQNLTYLPFLIKSVLKVALLKNFRCPQQNNGENHKRLSINATNKYFSNLLQIIKGLVVGRWPVEPSYCKFTLFHVTYAKNMECFVVETVSLKYRKAFQM